MWTRDNIIIFQILLWLPWFREKIFLIAGMSHRSVIALDFHLLRSNPLWLTLNKVAVNVLPVYL